MKNFLSILVLLIVTRSFAQPVQSITTVRYTQDELIPGERCVWIPVDFNDADLIKQIPDSLKGLSIQRIDLVYTTYKLNPDFNQERLNQSRMTELQSNWKETRSDLIAWRTIGQTAAVNADDAKKMFHGFVIYYRPTPTRESVEGEISFMDAFLESDHTNKASVAGTPVTSDETAVALGDVVYEAPALKPMTAQDFSKLFLLKYEVNCYDFFALYRKGTDEQISRWTDSIRTLPGVTNHVLSKTGSESDALKDCSIHWAVKKESCNTPAIVTSTYMPYVSSGGSGITGHGSASYDWMSGRDYDVVKSVFERNASWKSALVVMDVTGSMSPYIAQTMAWLKESQKTEQIAGFVFFNDGNQTPDNLKKTGAVGGVYGIANIGFSEVYDQMKNTMKKGFGGDCPENNIEATLQGIKDYPSAEEIVMVADNYATPRDLSLVSKLNKPVHVILCGASVGVNLAYVQLAFDTGGSVHTIESDLDSKGIVPGKTLKLGNTYFTLINGRIVKATNG